MLVRLNKKITLIAEITSSTDSFVEAELIYLSGRSARLELWMATCSYAHAESQHSLVVGVDSGGLLMTDNLALPCPPDCGEKGTILFSEFSTLGWSPSIAIVYGKLIALEDKFKALEDKLASMAKVLEALKKTK